MDKVLTWAVVGIFSLVLLAVWNRHLAAELRRRAASETPVAIPSPPPPPLRSPENPVVISSPPPTVRDSEPLPKDTAASSSPLPDRMRCSLIQMAFQPDVRARQQLLLSMGVRATLDDLLALSGENQLHSALFGLLNSSDAFRPANLMAWAERLPSGKDRQRAIGALAVVLSRGECQIALLEWLWGLPASDADVRNLSITTALQRMAATNPEEAEKWLARLGPDWSNASAIAGQLVNRRIEQDLNAAKTWASGLPSGYMRDEAFNQIANRLAHQSPDAAIEWCMAIGSDTVRNAALVQVMGRWIRRTPDETVAWISRLPSADVRDAATLGLIAGLAGCHPEMNVSWINDLKTVALWIETIEKSGTRRAAWSLLIPTWVSIAPDRAAEWVNGMEAGLVKDTALQSMALALAQTNPTVAWRWAESIQNSTMHNEALRIVRAFQTPPP